MWGFQSLVPSRGITGPAWSSPAISSMRELVYDPQQQQTPFPHQEAGEEDFWESKSAAKAGTVWLLQINYPRELCQKAGKTQSSRSTALVQWPRWGEGLMTSWKWSGDIGKNKLLVAQEEPILGLTASSKYVTTDNIMLIYTFGELMSCPNTHLKNSKLQSSSLYKQLWEKTVNILLGPNKWNKAILNHSQLKIIRGCYESSLKMMCFLNKNP